MSAERNLNTANRVPQARSIVRHKGSRVTVEMATLDGMSKD